MDKSPDAFRTISEVAEYLETPAHVLRFWESRFPQIRPVKRAGGRRYYRPADVALLTGIKRLLHDEGLTIRGVQKILREQGVRHVAGLSGEPLPDDIEIDAEAALEAALAANFGGADEESFPPERAESATIVALETALRRPVTEAPVVADLFAQPAPEMSEPAQPIGIALEMDLGPEPQDIAPADSTFDHARPAPAPRHFAQGEVAAALRALPAAALAHRSDELTALRSRLEALRQTLLAAPVFDRH